jgi:hypothetical protein
MNAAFDYLDRIGRESYRENGVTMMRTDAKMRGGLPQERHQNTDYEISIGSEFVISPYNLGDKWQQSTDQ